LRPLPVLSVAFLLACASPPQPDPAHGAVWGYVILEPKTGAASPEDSYVDRRLRNAAHFDYAHVQFAVVYAAGATSSTPARAHTIALEGDASAARFSPAHEALGPGETLDIVNRTAARQILSAPDASWLRELAPGERAELPYPHSGELTLYALRVTADPAQVWFAPGAYAVADAAGRYELNGLPPGPEQLQAWHPRLPPSAPLRVDVAAGRAIRQDIRIGVDHREEGEP
jgi:hypothetical protein